MRILEWLAVQAGGDQAAHGAAGKLALVATAQGMLDRLARGLGFRDLLVELGQFAGMKAPPLVTRNVPRASKGFLFGEREPGVALEQDQADLNDRSLAVASLAGDSVRWREQAEVLPVAQRRCGNAGAVCQFADRQQSLRHLDFKRT